MKIPPEEFLTLVDDYLEGVLTPEGRAKLEEILLESNDARSEFWKRAHLHTALRINSAEATGSQLAAAPAKSANPPAKKTNWWMS